MGIPPPPRVFRRGAKTFFVGRNRGARTFFVGRNWGARTFLLVEKNFLLFLKISISAKWPHSTVTNTLPGPKTGDGDIFCYFVMENCQNKVYFQTFLTFLSVEKWGARTFFVGRNKPGERRLFLSVATGGADFFSTRKIPKTRGGVLINLYFGQTFFGERQTP